MWSRGWYRDDNIAFGESRSAGQMASKLQLGCCRQEGQQRRDLQEAQNLGSFQPAFPSPDPAKQALYERLLAGASDHFQSSFQAKTHVLIDTLQV